MAYSTIDDIKAKIGTAVYKSITEKTDSDDIEPDDKAVQAIKDADAIINSYIREVTDTIPMNPVPDLIMQYSRDLAICELYKNQRQDTPVQWIDEKAQIIKYLKDISNGVANLDTGPDPDTAPVRISYGSGGTKVRRDRPL